MLRLDGSTGEGGGQIVRTALALAAVRGQALELVNIRHGRPHPGLGNQHLAAVRAVACLTEAAVEGDRLGATELRMVPRTLRAGSFTFDVAQERGSAGSVTLLLQAILPVLCVAGQSSEVRLRGGTHVPWSPPAHYAQAVLAPMLARMGMSLSLELLTAGWYPKGGGEVGARIQAQRQLEPQRWEERGALVRIRGWSLISNLPTSIADRQREAVQRVLARRRLDADIACVGLPSPGQGTCVVLVAECEHTLAGASALGAPGKRAEQVGKEAAEALLAHLDTQAALDAHLADQIVPLLALADGRSTFTTSRISRHLVTNLWTVQQCLPIRATLEGLVGQPGRVTLEPQQHGG
jgi:RNA 3'-terminal phosphate cyclase (ATP)